jgi:hypothetical protein
MSICYRLADKIRPWKIELRRTFFCGACSNRSSSYREVLSSNALYPLLSSRKFGHITQKGPEKSERPKQSAVKRTVSADFTRKGRKDVEF